jgi:hypothetical protein
VWASRVCGCMTFAMWAQHSPRRRGATTKELMKRIGHTTPGMAMRYQIAAAERDAVIAERLSELAGM